MIIDDPLLEKTIQHHIKEYLKGSLCIDINTEWDYGTTYLEVKLSLDDEEISTSRVSVEGLK
jgi:hypothetical protein